MVTDPSLAQATRLRESRQTTLACYTGLPETLPRPSHPVWRRKEAADLKVHGPSSGLEDGDGGQFNGDSEKGSGEGEV